MYMAHSEIKLLPYLASKGCFSSIRGLFFLAVHSINLFLYVWTINVTAEMYVLAATLEIIFAKYRHFSRSLKRVKRSKLRMRHYDRIHHLTVEMLALVNSANKSYSVAMFLFLLGNYPLNAYLTMSLVTQRHHSWTNQAMMFVMILEQILCIFVFHLVAVLYIARLHSPAKRVLTEYGSIPCHSPCDRLRVAHFIQAFHTTNRYGITYGTTGLVTLASFAKCTMFYFKFVMISYRLILDSQTSSKRSLPLTLHANGVIAIDWCLPVK